MLFEGLRFGSLTKIFDVVDYSSVLEFLFDVECHMVFLVTGRLLVCTI